MINIIKADLYRMTKSKGILIFWISLIVMFALTIFLKDNMAIGAMPIMETKMEDIKLDIRQLFFSANFYFLLIFPVYNIIVAEFSEKTIKNTISSSIDKNLYFISKFILTQIYSIGTFVLSNLVFYAANRLINGTEYSSDFGKFMSYVGWQCFVIFMLVNVLMAAAFLFAKATLFNSITIIFPFVFALIESILYSTKSKGGIGMAWVLAIIFGISFLVMLILYIEQKIEIKNIADEIEELNGKDTNKLVHSSNGQANELINKVNELLKNTRKIQYSCKRENHATKQMITNISHDMRTPLTSSMGYINLILHSNISEEEKKRELEIIERRLERLEELINSFFEFSKIISGEKSPELSEINLVGIVEESIAHYFDDYCEKGRMIKFECDRIKIPIISNKDMLMRIFDNLIGNALKHGIGDLYLKVSAKDKIIIYFENETKTGNIDITQIFDEFYTTDISRTKGGTGLGLAIAKQFAQMLGGEISADIVNEKFIIKIIF